MNTTQNIIEEIKQNSKPLNFGDTFNDAFELWKKVFGYGVVAFLIMMIFSGVMSSLIGFLPFMGNAQQEVTEVILDNPQDSGAVLEAYKIYFTDPLILGTQFLQQLLAALVFPLVAGMVYLTYKYDTTGKADFEDLFYGFKGNRFGKLVLLYIVYKIVSVIATFFLVIPFFIVWVGFVMASCFILFKDMGVMDSIKASFSLAMKNFWVILGLLVVSYLFAGVGFLGCIVGVLFTAPIIPVMCYVIYRDIVGKEGSEIEQIGIE